MECLAKFSKSDDRQREIVRPSVGTGWKWAGELVGAERKSVAVTSGILHMFCSKGPSIGLRY